MIYVERERYPVGKISSSCWFGQDTPATKGGCLYTKKKKKQKGDAMNGFRKEVLIHIWVLFFMHERKRWRERLPAKKGIGWSILEVA